MFVEYLATFRASVGGRVIRVGCCSWLFAFRPQLTRYALVEKRDAGMGVGGGGGVRERVDGWAGDTV